MRVITFGRLWLWGGFGRGIGSWVRIRRRIRLRIITARTSAFESDGVRRILAQGHSDLVRSEIEDACEVLKEDVAEIEVALCLDVKGHVHLLYSEGTIVFTISGIIDEQSAQRQIEGGIGAKGEGPVSVASEDKIAVAGIWPDAKTPAVDILIEITSV